MIVPANPYPPLTGFEYLDVNNFMGQPLGWLKWPNLFGLVFVGLAFPISTYFLLKYTRGFFGQRKIPRSWQFILWGIFITTIAEIGEMLAFYEWPNTGKIESNLLLLIPHALGGVLVGLGGYFLYKEVTS